MRDNRQSSLAEAGIFKALSPLDRDKLEKLFKPRSFGANETIFTQHEPGHCLYLICQGRAKICNVNPEGDELIFAFLSRGDILGEMAILDEKPRSATAVAVELTDTLYIERRDFLDFLQTSPRACIDIIAMLCGRLREADKHLEEISFLDVSCRLARKLTELAATFSPEKASPEKNLTCCLSQEELARVVGASRVIVNKILNSYVDLGLITLGRKKISIVDINQLSRIARFEY